MSITVTPLQGSRVRITASFTNLETPAVAADPTTVLFLHRTPDGIETVYTFGTDPEVIKDSVGNYHADLFLGLARSHYFSVNGTGALAQRYESSISVPESAFDTPVP